jgi:hypothetical protein
MDGTGHKVSLPLQCGIDQSATVSSIFVSVGMAALFIVLIVLAPIVAITGEWSEESSKPGSTCK